MEKGKGEGYRDEKGRGRQTKEGTKKGKGRRGNLGTVRGTELVSCLHSRLTHLALPVSPS